MIPTDNPADPSPIASELNNLLQIISGTSAQIENIWEGRDGAEKYFTMLRASIERAEMIAADLVKQAGGPDRKVVMHPDVVKLMVTPEKTPLQKRKCILVVDDEQMALTLLKHVLTMAGYHVVAAQSGFQCLDLFGRSPESYDLVVLDLAMPFMDGAETFERLRGISPGVSVVLTTGFIEQSKLDRLFANGLSAYLRKPYSPAETVECVSSALAKRNHQTAECGITAA